MRNGAVLTLDGARRYLTQLGGGVFGNRTHWIHTAIQRAVSIVQHEPVDIIMVSYGHIPKSVMLLDKQAQRILGGTAR